MLRRAFSALAAALLVAVGVTGSAVAAYPERPVTILVGFPPGGNVDITVRHAQPFLEKYVGGRITVVNKPGAAGALAYTELAEAEPDGYTLAMTSLPGALATQFGTTRRYDVDSFEHIANFTEEPFTIFVRPDSPFKSLKDIMDAAKANPGTVTLAGAGIGSSPHVGLMLLESLSGAKFNWVPMQGSAPMRTAVMGGHVDGGLTSVSVSMIMHVEGQVRVLGIKAEERWNLVPDVPTFKEEGYDIVWTASRGLWAPKGTPADIVAKWAEASRKTVEDPAFREIVERERILMHFLGSEDYQKYAENQNNMLRELWATQPWR